jgi:uncharacterized protein involved in outer membrane biogenesis
MKWLTRTALVLGSVAAVLTLVPFFFTLSDYVPLAEKEMSARLQQPVSIDGLHASLFPVPKLRVDGIVIGSEDEIKVSTVTLKPDLWSLFSARKVIRSAEFQDVELSQQALGPLLALAQRDRGAGTVHVEKVKLRAAIIKLEQASFGPFDVDVQLENAQRQGTVALATRDGAFEARIIPQGERYAVDVKAKSWTPPVGPPIRFDSLNVKGIATANHADLKDLDAKLYGGTVKGEVSVRWDEGVTLKGRLDVKQVELKDAAALVSEKTRVSGRLDAKPVFSAHANKAVELDDALHLETPFTVRDGMLHGFDLARAAAALAKQGQSGGQTRFDELAGQLVVHRRTYSFSQLRIAAAGLSARGHVTIARNRTLTGQLDTSIKALGTGAKIPLTVAGTLESPTLYPNTTALIGAAAGTAVLGPGVGTAAGTKLGEIAEELLGKRRKP